MNEQASRWPALLLLWSGIALSPFAWLLSFSLFLMLTNHGCGGVRPVRFLAVGALSVAIVVLAALIAFWCRARWRDTRPEESASRSVERARFMSNAGLGLALMFALLIAVSTLPVLWLSACPT
jgi:hypothetical protein